MALQDQIGNGVKAAVVDGYRIAYDLGEPLTDKQIEAMKAQGKPSEDGFAVYLAALANTKLDRHNEVFTVPVLKAFAEQINSDGITLNFNHDRAFPAGKVKGVATVEKEQDGTYTLYAYVYVDKEIKMIGQEVTYAKAIERGYLKDVSVEVRGSVQWVDAGENGGFYQWYIDANRPQATEISGLALVQKGAQRGAALSVKSIDGEPITKKEENSTKIVDMFKDKYFIGDKEYSVIAKQEGTEIKAEGIDALVADFKASIKTAAEAVTAKDKAEAENVTLKAELDEARKGFEADLVNYTKLNGKPEPTAEAIKAMSVATLKAASEAEKAAHDAAQGDAKSDAKTVFSDVKTAVKGMNF